MASSCEPVSVFSRPNPDLDAIHPNQYAIEPSVRSHQAPLSRHVLLSLLGSQITKLSSPPTISSSCPSRPLLTVRADLKQPDLVLLPTVLRNVYGLSIVEGKLWRGKKFNVAEIAAQKRNEKVDDDKVVQGEGSSVVTETRAAAAVAVAVAPTGPEVSAPVPSTSQQHGETDTTPRDVLVSAGH